MSGLRPVDPAIARGIIASVMSAPELPATLGPQWPHVAPKRDDSQRSAKALAALKPGEAVKLNLYRVERVLHQAAKLAPGAKWEPLRTGAATWVIERIA